MSGLSMSLPWLEVVAESEKKHQAICNTAFLFMPNGVNEHKWSPQGFGKDYKTSEILRPLESMRSEFDILFNLCHKKNDQVEGHFSKCPSFLSGNYVKPSTGRELQCGMTADQVIAQKLGENSPLSSIELGIEATRTGVDVAVGYAEIYGGHMAWKTPSTPIPKEIYPQLAFDRLFSASVNHAAFASILDDVLADVKNLNKHLGREDKARMDEFLSSVRSLEKRIARASKETDVIDKDQMKNFRPKGGIPKNLQEHMTLMLDIIVLAFKMKRTQVATLMLGNAVSGKNFSFLDGVEGGWHELSHHANNAKKLEMYAKINIFHMRLFDNFLKKLKSVKEGDKTLLDNSQILIGSSLRDGNGHKTKNLPILIAGGAGRNIERGRHRHFEKETPLCNLLLGMIQNSGVQINHFGDSTRAIH
ncbi:MAG: DUF1552 domain-containing protein [Lentisphaeraceae bacterium]|nr:DUF1552 domain-containing protein [Lentisphaeraceae bacterium]